MEFFPNEINAEAVVKIRIEAVGGDLDRVVCKYPRSFMDEMARQLTAEIESACGIEGLADSSVELVFGFAQGTFLEHISENVTYRRLMLIDSVSAPRDFWVKWTRLAGDITEYNSDNIRFELGEDVDQKIREREYRYLLTSGKDKYHNSMGRKKVTEWREVIKRAVKRGELHKIESDLELAPETLELEARIADLLGKKTTPIYQPEKEEISTVHSDESEFAAALEKMRMVVEETEEMQNAECRMQNEDEPKNCESSEEDEEFKIDETPEEEPEDEGIIFEELTPPETEDGEIGFKDLFDGIEESEEIEEIEEVKELEEIEEIEEVDESEEIEEIEEVEEFEEIEEIEEVEELEEIEEIEEVEELEEIEEIKEVEEFEEIEEVEEPIAIEEKAPKVPEKTVATPIADRAADIRAEIETKIRLEYESKARIKAEEELIALRREQQRLRIENETILAEAKKEQERLRLEYEKLLAETERQEAQREAEEAQRRAEEAELRSQIELQLRQEAMERERLAEAARMAIEEQHRLEAENARIARQREEEERLEAEARRREEEERELEALRQAELERIRREDEEAKERARAAMPEMGDGRYSYTSKTVKLIFRRSVDPNITTRIYEIIKATVEYYGKDRVYLKIKAIVPDSQTVVLEFEHIPLEEMALLGNIIKILGNSGLGIAKAIVE